MAISSFFGVEYSSFGWVTPYPISVARTRASAGAGSVDASTASTASRLAEMLEDFDFRGGKTAHFCTVNQCKSLVLAGMTLQNSNFDDEFTVLYVVCIFCQG